MVVGAGIAGVQAALDLANSGFFVHLVEKKPAIGGVMAQLDKTFPTNDCSMCIISPKLVECGRHLNIQIHTLTEATAITGSPGNFRVTVEKEPRFIDLDKCTGCGACTDVCPVSVPDDFNEGLGETKAISRLYPQAIPSAFAIQKLDRAPCALACPAEISVQGYVQLIKAGKPAEALKLIMERLPLPGVLGRVCPHPCEEQCRRAELDEPIAICSLKRYAADTAKVEDLPLPEIKPRGEKIAIVGSGPAGLTCAYHLALYGYRPTVFEALPKPGGMLQVGIPDYRLPKDVLDREIDNILRFGVELKTNSALGRDFTLDDLKKQGYKAVFLGVGCHVGAKLNIPGEDADGVVQGVNFLRRRALGEDQPVGKKLAVIGGGNVAMDVACTARRLGSDVTIVYRRSREEMPAHGHEIEQAYCEGVQLEYLVAPVEVIVKKGKVAGLKVQRMELGEPDESGRRRPVPIPGSEYTLDVDMVVPAIGQKANLSFLEDSGIKLTKWGTIEVEETTYQTSKPGVFAAGDVHTGPWIAIEAVGGGIEAAESIDRYLRGVDMKEGRVEGVKAHARWRALPKDEEGAPRAEMSTLPPELSCKCFDEITQGFTEAQAEAEASRCINCGICSECMQCVAACQAGAINHSMKPETQEINVGALIMSPGFKAFDPEKYDAYHYASYPNVISSLEFERILSASGPFGGHLIRPSDHQEPKKIAWLQCVGSRDNHHCDNSYCSAVCCMYAIKQAVIAKEHSAEPLDTAIFFMDMRTHGKDFEKYYWRAEEEHGVRFLRSRVHSIDAVPGSSDVAIRYLTETGELKIENFDMVVLSVGLESSPEALQLAQTLGIEVRPDTRFVSTDAFTPINTNKPGVYVCGAFQAPKDIPQSVMEASAAAAAAGELLEAARGTAIKVRQLPPETDVTGQKPRVGVFVCNCGINIGGVIDIPKLTEFVAALPNVVLADQNLFTCSADTQDKILEAIKENQLNRVVVASCSPRTHGPLFMETLQAAGLNPYLFDMANIRDQDSWVHLHEPEKALDKAKELVQMAVARVTELEPLEKMTFPVTKAGLVIGGGVAGLEAAASLADMGFNAYLVEKGDKLGGQARNLVISSRGYDYQGYLKKLIKKVENHPKVEILFKSTVNETMGFVGNFATTVATPKGEKQLEHGVTILATGGAAYKPEEYLYGANPNVLTLFELDKLIAGKDAKVTGARQAVFIQCVGSREPLRPYCSRVCCTHSVESALALKKLNPDMDVFVLYRDLRTYGDKELLYKEAREQGVMFIRFDLDSKPQVEQTADGKLKLTINDPILDRPLTLHPDVLSLATAVLPNPTEELGELFKVSRNAEGFFAEAHAKLRPVDFATDGIFLAGLAHYPKPIDESIAQAKAAAGRAATILAQEQVEVEPIVSRVDQEQCIGCGLCETSCPFGAIRLVEVPGKGWRAENISALCKGCGICAAGCPQRAIDMAHYRDKQILAYLHMAAA
jgi:heterodisulfide reductase subunit A-like polyferredoxin